MNLLTGSRFITRDKAVSEYRISSVYASPPAGGCSGGEFLNCALTGVFTGTASELLKLCRSAEAHCYSPKKKMNKARNLDVDLLYFDDIVRHGDDLILPHPGMHLRRFVLIPLAEISDRIIPGHEKSPLELLEICNDDSPVVLFSGTSGWIVPGRELPGE